MNSWQKTTLYIDTHESFTSKDLEQIGIGMAARYQYTTHLRKAEYIERISNGHFKRLKEIGKITVYAVIKEGHELE